MTREAAAEALGITGSTAHANRQAAIKKLGARGMTAAVWQAYRTGMYKPLREHESEARRPLPHNMPRTLPATVADPQHMERILALAQAAEERPLQGVSDRDLTVLRLLAQGESHKEICKKLGASQAIIRSALATMGAPSGENAVFRAYMHGILEPRDRPKAVLGSQLQLHSLYLRSLGIEPTEGSAMLGHDMRSVVKRLKNVWRAPTTAALVAAAFDHGVFTPLPAKPKI